MLKKVLMTHKSEEDSFIELQALEQQLMIYLVHWRCFLPIKRPASLYILTDIPGQQPWRPLPSFSSGFTAAWALNNGIPVQGVIIWAAREGSLKSREPHAESMQVKVTEQRPALIGRNGVYRVGVDCVRGCKEGQEAEQAPLLFPFWDYLCFLAYNALSFRVAFWHVLIINCPLVHLRVLIIRISNFSPLSNSQQPYPVRVALSSFAVLRRAPAGGLCPV